MAGRVWVNQRGQEWGQVGDQHAQELRKGAGHPSKASWGHSPRAAQPPTTNSPPFLLIHPWQEGREEAGTEVQARRPTPPLLIVAGKRGSGPSAPPEDETPSGGLPQAMTRLEKAGTRPTG